MPLQCTKCGYPALQELTCPECGSEDFGPATEHRRQRWWLVLHAVLGVLLLQAAFDVAHGIVIMRFATG